MNSVLRLFFFFIYIEGNIVILAPTSCTEDSDCSNSRACMLGVCQSPCREVCGPQALCVVARHKPYCFCREDNDKCLPKKVSLPCTPECGNNSICNTEIGYCECKVGYQGNPYIGCSKNCSSSNNCSSDEICVHGSCKSPCEDGCGVNSSCNIKNRASICSCPPGYTGNALEMCWPLGEHRFLTKDKICKQCGDNAACSTINNVSNCFCLRGTVGNPYKKCEKMCLYNMDCRADKICSHHVCKDPCEGACGVNTDCTIERYQRKPSCSCKEGFTGDPSRICKIQLTSRFAASEEELQCYPKCGSNATCDTKYGICTCNKGFIGNPYGECRKQCEVNSDCPADKACFDGDCQNPCLTACGKYALCKVIQHAAICSCPAGYSGYATKICRPIVTTQSPVITDVDICDSLHCGTNAQCTMNGTEECSCPLGYSGNPYKYCSKKCRGNSDCTKEEHCLDEVCEKPCKNRCGINALCKTENHKANCSCPNHYKGDPSRICFPDAKGILVSPSKVPCLKCICRAITATDNIFDCAEKSINFGYWAYAGEDLAGGENFRTRNSTVDFITCMNNRICILNTMSDYISRALHRLNDIDCDGKITCADYFAVHKFGLTAKFSDSLFNASEARSFDQCEGHGEEDISDSWTPQKCVGPSYVELLS